MRKELSTIYDVFENIRKNVVQWALFSKENKEAVHQLKKNKHLKDKYKGGRCFVLGNGPSLNSVAFSSLQNEYVFTVNQISRRDDFGLLKTNFHFWADPGFFDIDKTKAEDLELLHVMRSARTTDNTPLVFFPVEQLEFAKKHKLLKHLNIHFFKSGLIFHEKFNKEINYCKEVPAFGTVIHWCITMAIYMGFSEIYLLGCDSTGLISTIKSAIHEDVKDYTYFITENEQKRMENLLSKNSLYVYVQSYARMLKEYALIYEYCRKRNITLVNCSEKTAIDSIPRESLQKILTTK